MAWCPCEIVIKGRVIPNSNIFSLLSKLNWTDEYINKFQVNENNELTMEFQTIDMPNFKTDFETIAPAMEDGSVGYYRDLHCYPNFTNVSFKDGNAIFDLEQNCPKYDDKKFDTYAKRKYLTLFRETKRAISHIIEIEPISEEWINSHLKSFNENDWSALSEFQKLPYNFILLHLEHLSIGQIAKQHYLSLSQILNIYDNITHGYGLESYYDEMTKAQKNKYAKCISWQSVTDRDDISVEEQIFALHHFGEHSSYIFRKKFQKSKEFIKEALLCDRQNQFTFDDAFSSQACFKDEAFLLDMLKLYIAPKKCETPIINIFIESIFRNIEIPAEIKVKYINPFLDVYTNTRF